MSLIGNKRKRQDSDFSEVKTKRLKFENSLKDDLNKYDDSIKDISDKSRKVLKKIEKIENMIDFLKLEKMHYKKSISSEIKEIRKKRHHLSFFLQKYEDFKNGKLDALFVERKYLRLFPSDEYIVEDVDLWVDGGLVGKYKVYSEDRDFKNHKYWVTIPSIYISGEIESKSLKHEYCDYITIPWESFKDKFVDCDEWCRPLYHYEFIGVKDDDFFIVKKLN